MNDVVSMAQAEIAALLDLLHERTAERDAFRKRAETAEALLVQHELGRADEATEPEDAK